MFIMFRTRAWVPGCLSRGAWAASPGLLGCLPGAPWGGVPAQSTRARTWRTPLGIASKLMSISISIFDRFGLHLGCLLGVMLGHFGALVGPSWSWDRLRTILSSKKRFGTKYYVFQYFWGLRAPTWRPQSDQDRSKTGP